MIASSRTAVVAGSVLVLALGVETSRLAAAHAAAAPGGGAGWQNALQVSAAVGAVIAGLTLALDRRIGACGWLLALTGPAIVLAQVPVPDAGSALLFTAALAGGQLTPALAGSAALACPLARLRRVDVALITLSLLTAGAVRGLLPAAVFDPRATGCFACADNLAQIRSDPALYADFLHWGLVLAIGCGAGLAARTGWRWLRAPRIVRLVNAPLVLGGAAIALLAAAAAAHALQLPMSETDTTLRALWLAQCGLVVVMAVGVVGSALRARRLAGRVAEVVLAAVPDAASVRQALAASIDDPDLTLVFPRDDGTVLDSAGEPARVADSSLAVIRVTRAGQVVAEVRYSAGLTGASHQLAAAVRTAGLGVEHLAARARLRAELGELAASRLRIVETADAERRRLERDLHDGAQQRLIALQVLLQMASVAAPPALRVCYADARGEVGIALDELRALAHGIHPVVLTDAGLVAGLRTLAESSPVPLIVAGHDVRRHPVAVAAAAYRLVDDAIAIAGQNSGLRAVTVAVSDGQNLLKIRLSTPGLAPAAGEQIVARAQDRIVALEGSVTLVATGGEIAIEAAIPCAS
jgi:signal transduction histidine kinase